jgi:PPOX class probable F420-dependent enzyme
VSRRNEIALTPAELTAYVATTRTLTLCTHGPGGYPHAVAMWYAVDDDGTVWMSTYRKSQKAINVRRDAKVALHLESGQTYETLKGVLIRGEAELVDNEDIIFRTIIRVQEKMLGAFPDLSSIEEAIRTQARKRVAIKVVPRRVSSWDHSKLGGGY